MKGDFSRLTFDPTQQFTRVLMQQGRVQLDADWNEQAAILLHYLQALAADLIGPFGGPSKIDGSPGDDFAVDSAKSADGKADLTIGKGRYYVDGLLCENPDDGVHYLSQKGFPSPPDLPASSFLAYLDVWERHVTWLDDDAIREVALGGPDTATRAQLVWQVKATAKAPDNKPIDDRTVVDETSWPAWVALLQPADRGHLRAWAKTDDDPTEPCSASPEASFRGLENQLYRVEIHKGGTVADGATFKWSRDNGSVVFPILDLATDSEKKTTTVSLGHLGHDGHPGLAPDDWVEIVDDTVVFGNRSEPLLQVATVDAGRSQVILKGLLGSKTGQDAKQHRLLRRWDDGKSKGAKLTAEGTLPVVEGGSPDGIELENGVRIAFQAAKQGDPAPVYRTGDYWLIPARTATGNVEWPQTEKDGPAALPPHGVEHHYAPLAILLAAPAGGTATVKNLRRSFKRMTLLSQ